MIQYFYSLDYHTSMGKQDQDNESNELQSCTEEMESIRLSENTTLKPMPTISTAYSDLVIHGKVYALAEKYAVDGLKALALQKFKTAASQEWASKDMLEAAQLAYSSTVESDRGLRDAVVAAIYSKRNLLDEEEAQDVLQSVGMLSYDLLMYFHRRYSL